jgi:hypothetical protein
MEYQYLHYYSYGCRVTAHFVPVEGQGQRVTLLIKFDPHVIEREEMLSQSDSLL